MEKQHHKVFYLGLIGFIAVAVSVMLHTSYIASFDQLGQDWAQSLEPFHKILQAATLIAEPKFDLVYVAIIAVIIFAFFKRYRLYASCLFFAIIVGDAIGTVTKRLIHRPRPIGHLKVDDGFSFPSGHVLGMGIICLWLIMILLPVLVKNVTLRLIADILIWIFLLLVMISRVYFLAHYPSDVLGALFLSMTMIGIAKFSLTMIKHDHHRTKRTN